MTITIEELSYLAIVREEHQISQQLNELNEEIDDENGYTGCKLKMIDTIFNTIEFTQDLRNMIKYYKDKGLPIRVRHYEQLISQMQLLLQERECKYTA